jgi:predicted DNA binding CopG/RHH family protein
MLKKGESEDYTPRWMTECDVIRYNLRIPETLKKKLKQEAQEKGMDMSSYICGILGGDVKRPRK